MSIDQWREFELSRSNRNTDTAASSHKTNDELSPTNKTNKSNGISPSSFYKKNKTQPSTYSEQQLDNILNLASKNEVVQKRREFTSKHKAKEDAYDDVTQFRIFPLQDLAMDFLDEMTKECFDSLSAVESDQAHPYQISSVTTMNEHKRRKTICNDDSLIQLREQYTVEFLREMKYYPPTKKHVEYDSDGVTKSKEVKKRAINENARTVSNVDRAAMEDDAFEFLPVLWSMEPRIFAMETSSTGKRKYIVGNLGRFFHHYWKKSDPRSLHYYELIREGTPVRLYFDLEFCKKSNPQIPFKESEALMTEFIEELCRQFLTVYDIEINRSCIVDLDSSTSKKFSRHLIVHLPNGSLFADARSAGFFVKQFIGRLADELSTGVLTTRRPTLAKHLFVNSQAPKAEVQSSEMLDEIHNTDMAVHNDYTGSSVATTKVDAKFTDQKKVCFVDLGVYTRNRLFRLMGSSKFGKPVSAALRISDANSFPFPPEFDNSKFYLPDQTPRATNPSALTHSPGSLANTDHESFCAAMHWENHAHALAQTLVVPANASKIGFPILDSPEKVQRKDVNNAAQLPTATSVSLIANRPKSTRSTTNSTGESPIPKLDSFVLTTLGKRGGAEGRIRAWSMGYMNGEGNHGSYLLTYQMCVNRWCENIGRMHRSNNIMWTVDLTEKLCWQTCHDPECRAAGFRGRPVNVPDEVGTDINEYLLDEELAELDEHKIIQDAITPTDVSHLDFDDPDFEKELCELDISSIVPSNPT